MTFYGQSYDDRGQLTGDPDPGEPYSELGYAHRLIEVYGDRLRYVPAWRRWLVWDGKRWAQDTTGQAARYAKIIARRVTNDVLEMDDKERKERLSLTRRAESAAGVAGALTLSGTHVRIAVAPEDLDADPWLLNCQNGTLDLQEGKLRPHRPEDLITKVTGAAYDPAAPCTEFTTFLTRIMPAAAMRLFLRRLLGHSLPGTVVEHILPIMCGAGANGKSTLLENCVMPALGDYAGSADPAIFIERGFDSHPTGVADLQGRRLVVVQESDRNRHLAEGTVKRLTGGDRIKARRMREDFWEFEPSHTAVMVTNHPPLVRGNDEGIWRRLRMVPFEVVIPPDERDGELGGRLRLELDAVLAWLVAGYQDWRANGLQEPEQVQQATAEYRKDSDALGRFIDERCLLGVAFHVVSSDLYSTWRGWCEREGIDPGSQTGFSKDLQRRGFNPPSKTMGRMLWRGIGLAAEDGDE